MQQRRLELVGAIPTGPDPRKCHVCPELTELRCLVCRKPICGSHAFTTFDGYFCWTDLLEVLFAAQEISANA